MSSSLIIDDILHVIHTHSLLTIKFKKMCVHVCVWEAPVIRNVIQNNVTNHVDTQVASGVCVCICMRIRVSTPASLPHPLPPTTTTTQPLLIKFAPCVNTRHNLKKQLKTDTEPICLHAYTLHANKSNIDLTIFKPSGAHGLTKNID